MMTDENALQIRYANDNDINLITSSWLHSFRDGYFNATVANRVYYDQHHRIMEKLLPRSTVLVVCPPSMPQEILGWICCEVMDRHLVLHYIYVKELYRMRGVAKRLFDFVMSSEELDVVQNRVLTTHQTQKSKLFIKGDRRNGKPDYLSRHPERPIEFLYNPYMMFYTLPEGWESE